MQVILVLLINLDILMYRIINCLVLDPCPKVAQLQNILIRNTYTLVTHLGLPSGSVADPPRYKGS